MVDMFMIIKEIIVMKKLASTETKKRWFADGVELIQRIDPNGRGLAYYRLAPYRDLLKRMEDLTLITKDMRKTSPYGYGDDEEYGLGLVGQQLINQHKTNDAIRQALYDWLQPSHIDMMGSEL